MRKIALIALIAATPLAAAAQSANLTGIQAQAARILVQNGYDVDVRSLSTNQVAEIVKAEREGRRGAGFRLDAAVGAALSR